MTTVTRNRLFVCFILALLILPAELATVRAFTRGSVPMADLWVAKMSHQDRLAAIQRLDEYPVAYRRALIGSSSNEERATLWQHVTDTFVASHQNLTDSQRGLVAKARALAIPSTFADVASVRDKLLDVAASVKRDLGNTAYQELFLTAGPSPKASASQAFLPVSLRLENLVRGQFLASAYFSNCNCSSYQGGDCSGPSNFCSELQECGFESYGCGVWYLEACNGYCIPPPAN